MNNHIPETVEEMQDDIDSLFVEKHDELIRKLTDYLCSHYYGEEVSITTKQVIAKKVVDRFDKTIATWYVEGTYLDFDY